MAMSNATRACAIYTGTVASVCLVLSLTWWVEPSFGNRVGSAVLVVAFLSGLLGFFVWFVLVLARGSEFARSEVPGLLGNSWKAAPRLLRFWFAFVLAAAIVSFGIAWGRAGQWEAAAPYSDAPAGCHWPLYANHDTEHVCVSHSRWLDVNLQTARIFVGFGVIFLIIDCAAFTMLSRNRERPTKMPASTGGQPPYWPPPPGWRPEA
jgi:hypothetical protein